MICSMCHKNQAAIFSSKITPDGKREMEGLCINCAKKQGINTDEILQAQNPTPNNYNQINMNEMNKQLEGLIKNLSENLGDIEGVEFGAIPINENYDDNEDEENSNEGQPKVFAGAIPLGSIFGNLFGGPGAQNSRSEEHTSELQSQR